MRKKVWIVGMVLLLICVIFCGCGSKEEGEIISIKEAYDQGYLTEEDLLSVAYYRQGRRLNEELMGEDYSPKPKIPATLDKKTEEQIIKTIKKKTEEEYVEIFNYAGTYNNCIVIEYRDGRQYAAVAPTEHFSRIGGVTFSVWYPSPDHFMVYKPISK